MVSPCLPANGATRCQISSVMKGMNGWASRNTVSSVRTSVWRAPRCAADYQAKVSGPLLDRIDLHVEVQPVTAADLVLPPPAEGSVEVRARVAAARARQSARYGASGPRTNAECDGKLLETYATPDEAGRALLAQAAEAMRLTARGYTRVLRVARTIADLAASESITRLHIAEALSYRRQAPRN